MRSSRVARRQTMKDQFRELKKFVNTHVPLMQANDMLKRAYQNGFEDGKIAAAKAVENVEVVSNPSEVA